MKRLCATALMIAWALCALASEKSTTIVNIGGAKYYIHTVASGETLYALSKLYGVTEQVIAQNNPATAAGLKTDAQLKIPVVENLTEQQSERKLAKKFNFHYVTKGETLYNISRAFEIPVNTIIEDNPGLDPIHLRLGERILIRRKQIGSEDEAGSKAQWEEYRQTLNEVAEQGAGYHMVAVGETFYSLSRRFEISEEELSALNNGLKPADLKAGAILKVPAAVVEEPAVAGDPVAEVEPAPAVAFRALLPSETLRIALMLPMSTNGKANNNYLEFYQGFLMGLEQVKQQNGHRVQVDLYNTARNVETICTIIRDDADFSKAQLIVGPVYEETLQPIAEYAEQQHIPVVSPLANLTQVSSPVVFQLAPDPATKYQKVADLLAENKKITLIYGESTDKDFEQEILGMIGNRPYSKHTYRYVHPSTGSSAANGPSDLTPLLENSNDNVLIILADKEVDVDRILAALASADTSIVSRGLTPPQFVVLGNSRWNRFNNIDRTIFFKDRIVFLSTYHAKRDAKVITQFDSDYIRNFGSLPTLYSYRGYDTAMIFAPAMFGDIEQNLAGKEYAPLQTTYIFDADPRDRNHTNTNWTRVNYNTNFTITIE